jgi:LmbE family N-acetylglucosaminyl deacetylase
MPATFTLLSLLSDSSLATRRERINSIETAWVKYIEPADTLLDTGFNALLEASADPTHGVIYGDHYWVDPYTGETRGGVTCANRLSGDVLAALCAGDSMPLSATLIRTDLLRRLPDVAFTSGRAALLSLARAGARFAYVAAAVAKLGYRADDTPGAHLAARLGAIDIAFDHASLPLAHAARFAAYRDAVPALLAQGDLPMAARCLARAAPHAADTSVWLDFLGETLQRDQIDAPLKFAGMILASLDDAALKRKTRAVAHVIAGYKTPSRAAVHVAKAITLDRTRLRDRGLIAHALGRRRPADPPRDARPMLSDGARLVERLRDRDCIFLSPHFDDAALSCGGLLTRLAATKARLSLVTVFTHRPPEPWSPLAWRYHLDTAGAVTDFATRLHEDATAARMLSAEQFCLGLTEALWRFPEMQSNDEYLNVPCDPRADPVYPALCAALERVLRSMPNDAVLVAPLGLIHRDHTVVYAAARAVAPNAVFYEDYPYAAYTDAEAHAERNRMSGEAWVDIEPVVDGRGRLVACYGSQLSMLFGLDNPTEKMRAFARRTGAGQFTVERYWHG